MCIYIYIERERETHQKGSKEWHLELTMKPSFVSEVRETADYEAAAVKWSTLKKGRQLSAVVVEVQRTGIWLEVAPGLKGHVALLDASTDLEVLNDLPAHFKFGQVYETEVLDVNRAQKRLDLTLQKGGSSPSAGSTTLARLHQIGDVAGKGIAATFQLPGRCHAFAHVTELFDFWAAFPLKRLKPHKVYEAFVVRKAGEKDDPDAKFELSLRSSVVHGQKEGPEEMRPLQATDLKAGQIVSGYVVNAGPKGVFLALSRSLVARIRLKALSDALVSKEKVAKLYPPGTLIQTAKVVEALTGRGTNRMLWRHPQKKIHIIKLNKSSTFLLKPRSVRLQAAGGDLLILLPEKGKRVSEIDHCQRWTPRTAAWSCP